MGRGALLWMLGVPLPIVLLLLLFWRELKFSFWLAVYGWRNQRTKRRTGIRSVASSVSYYRRLGRRPWRYCHFSGRGNS